MAVAVLKAQLSAYLRMVKAGHEVLVTERGRVIARLVPADSGTIEDARYRQLVADGLVRPPLGTVRDRAVPWPTTPDPQGLLLKALMQDRGGDR